VFGVGDLHGQNGYPTNNANTFSQRAQMTLGLRSPPGPNPGPLTPPGQPTAARNKAQIAGGGSLVR
jgi:hypothetical protein